MEKTFEKGQGPPGIVSPMVVVVVVVVVVVIIIVVIVIIINDYDSHLQRDTYLWWGWGLQWWIGCCVTVDTVTQISPVNSAILHLNYFLHHTCHAF